jgi:hypothetical protein
MAAYTGLAVHAEQSGMIARLDRCLGNQFFGQIKPEIACTHLLSSFGVGITGTINRRRSYSIIIAHLRPAFPIFSKQTFPVLMRFLWKIPQNPGRLHFLHREV